PTLHRVGVHRTVRCLAGIPPRRSSGDAARVALGARDSIKDTGVGVAADDVPHLFDRFWQVRREDRHRGAGLGLFIVKGLVEAHDGSIWVESTLGKGTAMFFTIPLAPSREQLNAEREPNEL